MIDMIPIRYIPTRIRYKAVLIENTSSKKVLAERTFDVNRDNHYEELEAESKRFQDTCRELNLL